VLHFSCRKFCDGCSGIAGLNGRPERSVGEYGSTRPFLIRRTRMVARSGGHRDVAIRSLSGEKRTSREPPGSVARDPFRHTSRIICCAAQLSNFYSLWSRGNNWEAVAGVYSVVL
jgi:hypothetical protein